MIVRLVLFYLIPSLAMASPQDERAALIEQMSDTYTLPSVTPPNPNGTSNWTPSKILLQNCVMTIVSTSQNRNLGVIVAFTSVNNLSDIIFGAPDNAWISKLVEIEGTGGQTYGVIRFYSHNSITVNSHGPLPEFLGPEASAAFEIVRQEDKDDWRYSNSQTNEAEIAALARALLDYQQDFCTLSS